MFSTLPHRFLYSVWSVLSKSPTSFSLFCQVIDTGLDETSCFFIDDDGEEVDHGYYFDELAILSLSATSEASESRIFASFNDGDFSSYPERRKVREAGMDVTTN